MLLFRKGLLIIDDLTMQLMEFIVFPQNMENYLWHNTVFPK